jgi:2-dehydro-3-deoxygluconokinase
MADVVTFGEIMLRLTTPGYLRLGQASHLEVSFGGAEANVAVMIAQLGGSAEFVTRLPDNEIAQRALTELRALGVGVGNVARGGDRMGVYFLEQGASQRAGKVIYDRGQSAIAQAEAGTFDWANIFAGATWFHWSGITPALSDSAAALCAEASAAARKRGVTVSFDLNFRSKLWDHERAGAVLSPLMAQVDLCVTSREEAAAVFGIQTDPQSPRRDEEAARQLRDKFGFKQVALTQREASTANETRWSAMLLIDDAVYVSRRHEITIVDRVGAGDSFTGALIFALRRGDSAAKAVEFAVAASTLKHTIVGDYNLVTLDEVESLAAGGGGGRVRR